MSYKLTLPNGVEEIIPEGIYPCWHGGCWGQSDGAASVESVAEVLARAEREAATAEKRRDYLRSLMQRVLCSSATTSKSPGFRGQDALDALVASARSLKTDARHWTLSEAADRAETGEALADVVLTVLGVDGGDCPSTCEECAQHVKNLEGDEGDE